MEATQKRAGPHSAPLPATGQSSLFRGGFSQHYLTRPRGSLWAGNTAGDPLDFTARLQKGGRLLGNGFVGLGGDFLRPCCHIWDLNYDKRLSILPFLRAESIGGAISRSEFLLLPVIATCKIAYHWIQTPENAAHRPPWRNQAIAFCACPPRRRPPGKPTVRILLLPFRVADGEIAVPGLPGTAVARLCLSRNAARPLVPPDPPSLRDPNPTVAIWINNWQATACRCCGRSREWPWA